MTATRDALVLTDHAASEVLVLSLRDGFVGLPLHDYACPRGSPLPFSFCFSSRLCNQRRIGVQT